MMTTVSRCGSIAKHFTLKFIAPCALIVVCIIASNAQAQNDTVTQIISGPISPATLGPTATGGAGGTPTNPAVTAVLSLGGNQTVNYSGPGGSGSKTYGANWAFLVNDGTGSLEVFGPMPAGGYIPTVGDIVTVTGPYAPFNQIPEMGGTGASAITAITKNGTGGTVPAPTVVTVPQANVTSLPSNIAGYLSTVQDVTISGFTAGQAFGTSNLTLHITDTSSNSMTLFYWQTSYSSSLANLGGQFIPTAPQNITGFVDVFGSTAEFVPISMSPFIPSLPANTIYWYPNNPAGGGPQGGSGAWDTTSLNWNQNSNGNGTNVTATSANYVYFGGSQATNNVAIAGGGVTANGVDFASSGYVVSGGTLAMGSTHNTIDVVNGGTATITSQIVGNSGLNVNGFFFGNGTLVLNPTAGSENFTGDLTLTGGTTQVSSLSTLGSGYGNLVLAGGGLKVTTGGSLSIAASHSVLGGTGTFDLPTGSTLTINGPTASDGSGTNAPDIALPNTNTLILANNGSSTGGLVFLGGINFNGAGSSLQVNTGLLSIYGGTITNSSGGTVTVSSAVDFGASSSGDIVASNAAGKLVITGNVSDNGGTLFLSGPGTIDMQGSDNSGVNSTTAMNIGNSTAAGPTVYVHNSNSLGYGGVSPVSDNLNGGTISNQSGSKITFGPNLGLSIGSGGSIAQVAATPAIVQTFAGNDMEFQGPVNFFKSGSIAGEIWLNVNNTTTFSGGMIASTGTGTGVSGIVLGGTGTLNVSTASGGNMGEDLAIFVQGLKFNVFNPFTALPSIKVESGGVVAAKVANAYPTTADLTLGDTTYNGGTFATGGFVQSMHNLGLQANSTIDMGNGGSMTFAQSSSNASNVTPPPLAWASGAVLRISNWKGNASNPTIAPAVTPFVVGTSVPTALTSGELAQIHFTGYLTGAQELSDFEIVPLSTTRLLLGDVNQNQHVNAADILPFESALSNLSAYESSHSFDLADTLDILDVNHDGQISNADLQSFLLYLKGGNGSLAVPEPSSIVLGLLGMAGLATMARRRRQRTAA